MIPVEMTSEFVKAGAVMNICVFLDMEDCGCTAEFCATVVAIRHGTGIEEPVDFPEGIKTALSFSSDVELTEHIF